MAAYKLDLDSKELLGMLSNYYTDKLGHPIDVQETTKVIIVDDHFGDTEIVVKFSFEEVIEILGNKAIKTSEVTEKDICDILTELIGDTKYRITGITYNSRYLNRDEGCFEGITVSLLEKQLGLRKKNTYEEV